MDGPFGIAGAAQTSIATRMAGRLADRPAPTWDNLGRVYVAIDAGVLYANLDAQKWTVWQPLLPVLPEISELEQRLFGYLKSLSSTPSTSNLSTTYAARGTAATAGRINWLTDSGYSLRDNGSTWDHFVGGWKCKDPSLASFGWGNQGTATLTDTYGGELIQCPSNGVAHALRTRTKAAPAAPYNNGVVLGLRLEPSQPYGFVFFGWSDGTKYQGCMAGTAPDGNNNYSVYHTDWTNATSIGIFTGLCGIPFPAPGYLWVQLVDDNTNCTIYLSSGRFPGQDGWQFLEAFARTSYLSSPSKIAYGVDPYSRATSVWLYDYEER